MSTNTAKKDSRSSSGWRSWLSQRRTEKPELQTGDLSKRRLSSGAGPTPFHRRTSYVSRDDKERRPLFKWHIYDNKGSYNGWFDWVPEWMRVGYWSPFAVLSILSFYFSVYFYKPRPLEFAVVPIDGIWFWADVTVFFYGVLVLIAARAKMGNLGAFLISYTGWSWFILTARAGLTMATPMLEASHPSVAAWAATLGSALRFPTAVAAVITFSIWNLILLPIIYYIAVPAGKKRDNFIRFNFSFIMTSIHVLNLPLALVNTVYGDGARPFTVSDLWVGYLVAMLYSLVYVLVNDRLGLHFYPMFSPRSALCGISFGLVLALYYYIMKWGNTFIMHWNP